MRSRASGAVCLDASFCCFCERSLALSALRLFPISLTRSSPSSDVRCRIAQERVLPVATASANQIGKLQASSPRCSPHARSGSNPRLLCLTNIYFGQQWISSIFDLSLAHGDFSTLVHAAFCCSNIQNTFHGVSAGHQNKGFPIFCTLTAIGKCPVSFNGDSALPCAIVGVVQHAVNHCGYVLFNLHNNATLGQLIRTKVDDIRARKPFEAQRS